MLRSKLSKLLLADIALHLPWNSAAVGNSSYISNKESKVYRFARLQVYYSYHLHFKHRVGNTGTGHVFSENVHEYWHRDICVRILHSDNHFLVSDFYSQGIVIIYRTHVLLSVRAGKKTLCVSMVIFTLWEMSSFNIILFLVT